MGTRHLIAVQVDGEYKIAQYGQWDGYPSGQGVDILSFLKEMDRPTFEAKARAARFLTQEDMNRIAESHSDWPTRFPELSRDAGSDILKIVNDGDFGIKLRDNIDFAGDSLSCEYAYVIDLDKRTFEVFEGFNQEPVNDGERFAKSAIEKKYDGIPQYYGVKFMHEWQLDKLPSEKEFLEKLEPKDED